MHSRIRSQPDKSLGDGVNRPMPRSTRHEESSHMASILLSSKLFTKTSPSPNSIILDDASLSSSLATFDSNHVNADDNSDRIVSLEHSTNTPDFHPFSSKQHQNDTDPSQNSANYAGLDIIDQDAHSSDRSLLCYTTPTQNTCDPLTDSMPHRTKDKGLVHPKSLKQDSKNASLSRAQSNTRGRKKKNLKVNKIMSRSESEDSTTVQSIPTVKASNLHLSQHLSSTFYDSSDGSTLSSCSRDVLNPSSIRPREHSSFIAKNNTTSHKIPTFSNPLPNSSPLYRSAEELGTNIKSKQTQKKLWLLNRKTKTEMSSCTSSANTSSRRHSLVSKLSHMLFSRSSSPIDEEPNLSSEQGRSSFSPERLGSHHPTSHNRTTTTTYEYLDTVIQKRWDGMDLLSLGPAHIPRVHDTTLDSSFYKNTGKVITGHSLYSNPLTCDSVFPVLVMDGYQPSGEDRWSISIIQRELNDDVLLSSSISESKMKRELDETKPTLVDETKFNLVEKIQKSSFHMPHYLLLSQMHTTTYPDCEGSTHSEPQSLSHPEHLFPPSSSCPMDTDEDIFLIQSLDNLKSIYDAAADHIENSEMDLAVEIMEKLNRSLLILHGAHLDGGDDEHHVIGTAYHNLGVVQMWASRYEHALLSFHAAVRIRSNCTTSNATCLAVSLSKLGIVHFALDHFEDALECFESCFKLKVGLDYVPNRELQNILSMNANLDPSSLEIGKIMNNMGISYYQTGRMANALYYLTQSLEYYKSWIEGPLKRESLLYDASVVIGNIGRVYLEKGDCDMAVYMYEEAFMLHSSYLKPNSLLILTSLGNIAFAKAKSRDFSGAQKILGSIQKNHGKRSDSMCCPTLEVQAMMGLVLIHQSEFSAAYEKFKDVMTWQRHKLHHSHPAVMNTANLLSEMQTLMETEI